MHQLHFQLQRLLYQFGNCSQMLENYLWRYCILNVHFLCLISYHSDLIKVKTIILGKNENTQLQKPQKMIHNLIQTNANKKLNRKLFLSNFSLLGYKFNDGKMEEQEQYLKRISGLQRLYSAVLITKVRRTQQHIEHPHGLENGWIWFTNFLMLDPLPGISSTLLLEFIQICGSELWHVYKKQFIKLLIVLHKQYVFKLNKVSTKQ